MSTLLHISASPRGAASHSRTVGDALVRRLLDIETLPMVERDLVRHPPPYPDHAFVEASLMAEVERGPAEVAALAGSEALIGELEAASLVVIDTPMHNFTVPAALKSWIDHLVRPGRTFRSTSGGKQGLLADRPVFLVVACGGPVSDDGNGQTDFLIPYIRYVLATIGLHDLATLRLDNLRRGDAAIARAETRAADWITAEVEALRNRRNL